VFTGQETYATWLLPGIYQSQIIIDENLLKRELVEPLLKEAEELTAIFVSSRKTARKSN